MDNNNCETNVAHALNIDLAIERFICRFDLEFCTLRLLSVKDMSESTEVEIGLFHLAKWDR